MLDMITKVSNWKGSRKESFLKTVKFVFDDSLLIFPSGVVKYFMQAGVAQW